MLGHIGLLLRIMTRALITQQPLGERRGRREAVGTIECQHRRELLAGERVIGADANPYVAFAATLACGYLGIKNKIEPASECKGDAYLSEYQLPRSLSEALGWLADEKDLHDVLGKSFITVYSEVKEIEHDEFMKVISPWEREHLLLHV